MANKLVIVTDEAMTATIGGKSVSTLHEGDFLVVYPASAERADDRQFLRLR